MLANLCLNRNLFGCKGVTSQTTTLNLANCICQQEFLDSKIKKFFPNFWWLSFYFYSFVVKSKLL